MIKKYSIIVLTVLFVFVSIPAFAQEAKDLIAYSRLTDNYWQIWVMNLDSQENTQLTHSPVDKRYPIWLDNGKRIMYRTNNAEMFILDLAGSKETQILERFGVITDPAYSSANNKLVFTRYEGGLKDESEIWSISLDGEDQKVLTNQEGMQYNPNWSPDGERILYTSGKTFGTHQIWLMTRDGKNNQQLTQNTDKYDILPAFSPDGRTIAFASNRLDNFDIWTLNLNTKALKRLTENDALDTKPSFSPDGKKVVFTSARTGSLQLWVMNADGTGKKQITDGKAECQDGSWIRSREEKVAE